MYRLELNFTKAKNMNKYPVLFTRFTAKTSEDKTRETNMLLRYICWIFDKERGTFSERQLKIDLFSQD